MLAYASGFVFDHECTLILSGVTVSYGHSAPDWTTSLPYSELPCRWQEITTKRMATLSPAGAAIGDHELWFVEEEVPIEVLIEGGQREMRIVDIGLVSDEGLLLIDEGPFDVSRIERLAGAEGMLHVLVKRVS